MAAIDAQTIGRLIDDLTRVEQSARRVRTPDDGMPVIIRDAWQTIGALVDDRARLLATIDALKAQVADQEHISKNYETARVAEHQRNEQICDLLCDVLATWLFEVDEEEPAAHRDALIARAMATVLQKESTRG